MEPKACPTLTKGLYTFDYGDSAKMAPLVKMQTLGHSFVPTGIHAGGLRYHGTIPRMCALHAYGDIDSVAIDQISTFETAVQFAQAEGIVPAPESAHAVRVAIKEALRCKEEGTQCVIAFNLSGDGHFDLAVYKAYLRQELQDYEHPMKKIEEAMKDLPEVAFEE